MSKESICDKRKWIVLAALELIAEKGYHGTTAAKIAENANVSVGTIYRYFESKDVLITELYKDIEDGIYLVLIDGYDPERPIRERFLHIVTKLLKYLIDNPIYCRYIRQFLSSPYGVLIRREHILGKRDVSYIDRKLFEDGVSQQEMKILPISILYNLSFGSILELAQHHDPEINLFDDSLIVRAVEASWDAIKR